MATPPSTIDYTDSRNLRVNELLLLTWHCGAEVQKGMTLPKECAEERQCIDEKNLLEGFQLVLAGCAAQRTQTDREDCDQKAINARRAEVSACIGQKHAVEDAKYEAERAKTEKTQRIDEMVREAQRPTNSSRVIALSALYYEGIDAVSSPECHRDNTQAFHTRYGIYMNAYTHQRLYDTCATELPNITKFFVQGLTECLQAQEDNKLFSSATQCLATAAAFTVNGLWSVSQFQQEWKKFYASTKAHTDLARTEQEKIIATLTAQQTEAKQRGDTRTAKELEAQLEKVRAAQTPIPVVDVDTELAAHRKRVEGQVQAFKPTQR